MTRLRWPPNICAIPQGISPRTPPSPTINSGMIQAPHPFHLRTLTTADIPALLAIERFSFPTAKSEAMYAYELTQNKLAHYQALTRLETGEAEKFLGYAGDWIIAGEFHISMLAVDPALRRQGLGQLLLLNILFQALEKKASLVTLEVRVSNEAAQKLYQKYRFEEVRIRRRYYRDTGEDAIVMAVFSPHEVDYVSYLQRQRVHLFQRLSSAP